MTSQFMQYLRDTKGEMSHVSWPSKKQTVAYTVLVVAFSIFIALYLGLFDFLFTTGLAKVIEKFEYAQSVSVQPQVTVDPVVSTSAEGSVNIK